MEHTEQKYKAAIEAAMRLIDEGYDRLAREVLADALEHQDTEGDP